MKRFFGWLLAGMLIFCTAVSFATDSPDRVDADIGIYFADIDFEKSIPEIKDFEVYSNVVEYKLLNDAEVEISPGDNLNLVSSVEMLNRSYIETLQGSTNGNKLSQRYSLFGTNYFTKNYLYKNNIPKTNTGNLIANRHSKESEVSGLSTRYNSGTDYA